MQGTEDFSSNFFIDEVKEGKLVINPDTLTVIAQDTNRMYGMPEPEFRSVITGFNGADTREGSVFGSISYNTESNISSIPDGGSLTGGKYWILPDVSALTKPIYTAIDIVRNRAFYDEARQNPLPKLFRDKREDRKKDDAPQAINNDNTEKAS